MKYTHDKLSVEFSDWLNDQSEFLRVLAFVHDVFKNVGNPIPPAIPTPIIKITSFHYNTRRFIFCKDDPTIIYLQEGVVGKEQAAALIASLTHYYSKHVYPGAENEAAELREKVLDKVTIDLTLSELALTSAAVVTGVLVAKKILNKIF